MRCPLLLTTLLACLLLHTAHTQTLPDSVTSRTNAYDADSLKTGEWVYYYNADWGEAAKGDSIAYYRLITYQKGQPTGTMGDYYANGQPQMLGTLLSEAPQRFDGPLTLYGSSGIATYYGYYKQGTYDPAASLKGFEALHQNSKDEVDHNQPDYATFLNNLANVYYQMGRYAEAEAHHQQALEIRETALGPNHPDYATSLNNLAYVYNLMGRYIEAEALHQQALEIRKTALGSTHPLYATSLYNLAVTYHKMARYAKAETLHLLALEIRKTALGSTHNDYAQSLNALSNTYERRGRYIKAERLQLEALEIKKITIGPTHSEYATSLNNLALLYYRMGRYVEAELLYLQAQEIWKTTLGPTHPYFATSLNNLASINMKMGRYAEAERLLKQVQEIWKTSLGPTHPQYATVLTNLAQLYMKMERNTEAELLYLQALEIWKVALGPTHPKYALGLDNLAVLYDQMSHFAKAEPLYQQALEIRKTGLGPYHEQYARSLHNIANLYKQTGRYPEATANYQRATEILKTALGPIHQDYVTAVTSLAYIYWLTKRESETLPLLHQVVTYHQTRLKDYFDYLGEAERRDYYATINEVFEAYTGLAIEARERHAQLPGQALNLQLQHKALLLSTSNQIKQRIIESGDRKLIDLYDEVEALRQALGQQHTSKQDNSQMDSLRQLLRQKDQALTQYSARYKAATIPATWQALQGTLEKREALVELVRYRDYDYQKGQFTDTVHYAAFIITPKVKEPLVVELPNGNFLEDQAIAYYQNAIRYRLENNESYDHFWAPLQAALKRIDKVYLSPDGVYHQLNMETLRNPKTGQYLFEELDLQVITSGRDLLAEAREPMRNNQVLLMGNPDFGTVQEAPGKERGLADSTTLLSYVERGNGLAPLPGTEREIQQLQALFTQQGWYLETLLGPDATEEALKDMLKPKVLHIATHGFFQEEVKGPITYATDPLYRSGLLLSGAANTLYNKEDLQGNVQQDKEDGILTAFEAKNLNIDNTELVVLSACETGLGEIRNGEGVYGLQRALKVAGARSIMMSLWKVNDQTTQQLMVSFYKYWLGGMTKRAAFRKAQLDLMAQYPHPYYWGAFVLIGE